MGLKHVIPIMLAGTKTANLGMKSHHKLRLLISSSIRIEAAVNRHALLQQVGEPSWIGTSSGGRDGATVEMKDITAKGVDGRLAQHDHRA